MRTRRLLGATTVTLLLAAVLTGCVKVDLDLQLQPDDTIDGSLVFAVSSDLAETLGEDGATLSEGVQEELLGEGAPENATSEPYDDGEYVGSTLAFEGESLSELAGDEDLQITRDGDEFVVTGVLDLTDTGAEGVPGLDVEPQVRMAVTFPGEVTEHDGELEGTTVVWTPVPGERTELNARGSAIADESLAGQVEDLVADVTGQGDGEGSGLAWWLLVPAIGLALLLVIGLVLVVVLSARRRRRQAANRTEAEGIANDQATSYGPVDDGPGELR
ncbi:hypothetical protein [Actinotalea sp. C106]|uniref:LppM family (lipo)protein n=1 Tax=Actinotalea sp. C106 TaxID=2908644 RepID=UPI00202891EF|nr:hypothetical protein [Actinotalea sp. C106]